jgi:hypothetical protein
MMGYTWISKRKRKRENYDYDLSTTAHYAKPCSMSLKPFLPPAFTFVGKFSTFFLQISSVSFVHEGELHL